MNEAAVVRKFRTTGPDGKNYNVAFYNLDMIISVGYRVKSRRGVQFRIWATERLREYLIKGFTMKDMKLMKVIHVSLHERGHDRIHAITRFSLSALCELPAVAG